MYEEEYRQIKETLQRLQVDSNAKIVFLVDKNGQQIASHGDMRDVDATSLASLTAGNVAATDGLAKLIGEKEFSILFHEGERDNIRSGAPAREESVAGARADVRAAREKGGSRARGSREPLRFAVRRDH